MEEEDARKQSSEALFKRRKQAIRLLRNGGGTMRIVGLTGLSYPAVRSTIDRFDGWRIENHAGPAGPGLGRHIEELGDSTSMYCTDCSDKVRLAIRQMLADCSETGSQANSIRRSRWI
jgi:hypothetical protein